MPLPAQFKRKNGKPSQIKPLLKCFVSILNRQATGPDSHRIATHADRSIDSLDAPPYNAKMNGLS
jgi:hypothetical protein